MPRRKPNSNGPRTCSARSQPLILGVPEVISTIDAVLGLSVLKANFRSITGYPGKADVRLALLRNEINLDSQATPIFEQSVRPSVKDGQAIPLFAQGFMDGDQPARDPAAPDVPSVGEAYQAVHGVAPSGPAWDAYKAVARAIGNGGKIMMMHSDAPPKPARRSSARSRRWSRIPSI